MTDSWGSFKHTSAGLAGQTTKRMLASPPHQLSPNCPPPPLHLSPNCSPPQLQLSPNCPPPPLQLSPNCSPPPLQLSPNCPPPPLQLSPDRPTLNDEPCLAFAQLVRLHFHAALLRVASSERRLVVQPQVHAAAAAHVRALRTSGQAALAPPRLRRAAACARVVADGRQHLRIHRHHLWGKQVGMNVRGRHAPCCRANKGKQH
eukprot:364197-Chlamydomonas_euryale.AAC.56